MTFSTAHIPHNKPLITDDDRMAVHNALLSGWLARGKETEKLETSFEDFMGGGGAVAVSSGTAALFLALKAFNLGKGQKIALPTYACSALLNAVYMTGAEPLLMDCKKNDFTICPDSLANSTVSPDAIIAVHTYGARADIETLQAFNVPVIEDCCQSLGGRFKGRPIGITGAYAVFSFYATKIITGGYGGLAWFPEQSVANKAKDYINFDCRETYEPRFNFHIGDMQSALILSQFKRLCEIKDRRSTIARLYDEVLPSGFTKQFLSGDDGAMPYRYVVRAHNPQQIENLKTHLAHHHISGIIPLEPYELLHRYLKHPAEQFPNAEYIVQTTLSLPLYPALSDNDVRHICEALDSFSP